MRKNLPLILKFALVIILALGIWSFFYFESSLTLRILILALGAVGLFQIKKMPEILVLTNVYLIIYDLYNIRYGLAVPLAIIMIIVLVLSVLVFYINLEITQEVKFTNKNLLLVYLTVISLVVLEIFLAMSYWPVDPKTKSITITVAFYVIIKAVYLHANNMLSLKRVSGFIIAGILVLSTVFSLSYFYGM
ncbi:MAG: hypothetical protein HW405_20 [Candidatus Berkelbacteria bacterium]|nr:hypothetical protein [Candidatus Berkelbacteria bacterium]